MAAPKRANVYREADQLVTSWQNGNRSEVLKQTTRPGPIRTILPALIYHKLSKIDMREATIFLQRVMSQVCRD